MTDKVSTAANKLETLLPHFREIVNEIRDGNIAPYAAMYEARRELSRIVATLGVGVPGKSGHSWNEK